MVSFQWFEEEHEEEHKEEEDEQLKGAREGNLIIACLVMLVT